MSKPFDYQRQDGCHNCHHVFVKTDFDCGPLYFCTLGAPPRPKCGSCAMDENFGGNRYDEEAFGKALDEWDAWEVGREVNESGKCGRWSPALPTMEKLDAITTEPCKEWRDDTTA